MEKQNVNTWILALAARSRRCWVHLETNKRRRGRERERKAEEAEAEEP